MIRTYHYIVIVKEVLDPIRFIGDIEFGQGLTMHDKVFMLSNVHCPSKSSHEDEYFQAMDFLAEMIEEQEVLVETDGFNNGAGISSIVYLDGLEESVNHIIANGLAEAYYDKLK
jgi:hypothetical protein